MNPNAPDWSLQTWLLSPTAVLERVKRLTRDGYILINTSRSFEDLGLGEFAAGYRAERLCTVPATEFALKHIGRPLPNAALLGGFAAISGEIGR